MSHQNFKTPRGLSRKLAFADFLFKFSLVAAYALLFAFAFVGGWWTHYILLLACVVASLVCLQMSALADRLAAKLLDSYEREPCGLFFTGSLYLRNDYQTLLRMRQGTHNICTRLSRNPYPDAVALGGNGVVKEEDGRAWIALLVSVNGNVNVTRVRPAEFGWPYFIQEKLR